MSVFTFFIFFLIISCGFFGFKNNNTQVARNISPSVLDDYSDCSSEDDESEEDLYDEIEGKADDESQASKPEVEEFQQTKEEENGVDLMPDDSKEHKNKSINDSYPAAIDLEYAIDKVAIENSPTDQEINGNENDNLNISFNYNQSNGDDEGERVTTLDSEKEVGDSPPNNKEVNKIISPKVKSVARTLFGSSSFSSIGMNKESQEFKTEAIEDDLD